MPEVPPQPSPPTSPQVQPEPKKGISWKKILISVGVIAVVAGIIGGALLWYFCTRDTEESTSVTTTKQASPSAKKDATSEWKIIENDVLGYSIKYPNGWGALRCNESSTDFIDDKEIQYSNPEYSKVLAGADPCSSGARTRIIIFRGEDFTDDTAISSKYGASKHTNYKKEEITVDGKSGIKSSYISKQAPGIQEGVEFIEYIIDDGKDQALIINYYRPPDDDLNPPYTDYSDTVEKMVSTLKFLD